MTNTDATHTGDHAAGRSDAAGHASVVSLTDILERRVPLEWYESVAVVAGLCTAMVDSHATGMPAPEQIVLAPQGTIVITGPQVHEFVALPRLLHELLSVTTPPTPLRLLVLHTISSDADKSPSAFGAALAYYERPGREEWIRAARQRCLETPVPNDAAARPTLSELFDIKKASEPKKAEPTAATKASRKWPVVALASGVAVAALALAASYRTGNVTVVNGVSVAQAVAAHVTEAGRGFAKAIAAQWTGSTDASSTPISTADATPTKPKQPRSAGRRHDVQDVATVADGGQASSDAETLTASNELLDSGEVVAPAGVESTSFDDLEAIDARDALVRQEPHNGITPPRLLDPVRLPSWAQESTTESPNVIELDIADTGKVARVRLISPTTRLTDMMILSAAKTWIFEPASEGGRAVPYRMTLNWVPSAR